MAMTTVVDSEAVQVHQTDPPLFNGPPGKELLVSAFSRVAPARVPLKVIEEPARAVRLAKSSFAGAWPNAVTSETSVAAAKKPDFRVLMCLESRWSTRLRSSNRSARKRGQRWPIRGKNGPEKRGSWAGRAGPGARNPESGIGNAKQIRRNGKRRSGARKLRVQAQARPSRGRAGVWVWSVRCS